MQSRSIHAKILPYAVIATIFLYLLAFINIPIFYDEAAFRRSNGRALIDGFSQFMVFPDCRTPKAVSWLFIPAHALFSWLDGQMGWNGVRLLPLATMSILVGAVAALVRSTVPRNWIWSILLLAGGFVGLAGTGMVLSRAEFVTTLHVALCVTTWLVARKSRSWQVVAIVLVLHLVALNLSLFVHPQSQLLIPFSILTCAYLLRRSKPLMWLVVCVVLAMSAAAIPHQGFYCPEDPALEQTIARSHGVVLSSRFADVSVVEQVASRLWLFVRQFPFQAKEAFSIPAPPIPGAVAAVAALPIGIVVAANFLILIGAAGVMTVTLLQHYFPLLMRKDWHQIAGAFFDGRVLWTGAALAVLVYSAYDLGGMFYRAHFRNLLTVVVLAIGVCYLVDQRMIRWSRILAVLSGVTSLGSAIIAWTFIVPQLAAGYESYYVSVVRDWPAHDKRVRDVAAQCGIGPTDEHVVVDVATYQAMRENPRPLDFNYVWYRESLEGNAKTRTKSQWAEFYRKYSDSGYIVMCRTLTFAPMSVSGGDGQLCCGRF